MKTLKFIFKEIIFPASFFFTMFNIIVYIMDSSTSGDSSKLKSFMMILAYCIIVAFANNIFKTESSSLTKVLVHYLSILIPLLAYMGIIGKASNIPGIFIGITVIYVIIAAPILIIRNALSKKENEEQKYDSQFK